VLIVSPTRVAIANLVLDKKRFLDRYIKPSALVLAKSAEKIFAHTQIYESFFHLPTWEGVLNHLPENSGEGRKPKTLGSPTKRAMVM
jgi:hypothetical protein